MSLDTIRQLHADMTAHALWAGIKETVWEKVVKDLDKRPDAVITIILAGLRDLYDGAWTAIESTRTLPHINDEMWENYEWMFDGAVLPEQKTMNQCKKRFCADFQAYKKKVVDGTKKAAAEKRTRRHNPRSVDSIP